MCSSFFCILGLFLFYHVAYSTKYHKRTIVVVGDKSYPPFEFLDVRGNPKGIFVDIWNVVAKKAHIRIEYKLMEWKDALKGVREGKYDVVGALFYSKERARYFDFTEPYMEIDTRIFFNKKIFALDSLDDLVGFEVGVLKDDYAEHYIKTRYPNVKLKTYLTIDDMIKDAINGNIKVFVCDTPVALFVLSKYKKGDNFKYSTRPIYTSKVYSAVKKGNMELLNIINQGFKKISKKEIDSIVNKWTGVQVHFLWKKYVLIPFLMLSALTLIVFIWSLSLKKAVNIKTMELVEKNNELRKLYNRLNTIIKTTNMGYAERDMDGYILDANEEYLKLVGRKREEVVGRNINEWIHPEDLILQKTAARILEEKGYLKRFEIRYLRPDKKVVYILANAATLEEGQKKVLFLCQDITDIKRQQEEIATLAAELEITLNSIGDGVISTDGDGKIRFFNPVAEKITGWKKDEAVGRDFSDIFHILSEKTGKRIEDPYNVIKRTKKIIGLGNHTLLVRKNGERIPILDSGAPIFDKNGEIMGVVVVFRDGSEQRKREEELLKIERLSTISKVSAGIAHDFNNLLGIMLSNLSLIKTNLNLDKKGIELIERMEKAAVEARNFTKQLILLGREFNPEFRPLDYSKKIEEITRFILAGTSIVPVFSVEENLYFVHGDEAHIDQLIQNLIINARDAMPEGGSIFISAKNITVKDKEIDELSAGKYVCISVRDEGMGIDKKDIEKIFDPYFSTKKGGTGLGLYVVKNIIDNHNGHIEVLSEKYKGTEFKIYLPATEKSPEETHGEENITLDGKRILFMDDEDMFRDIMGELIPHVGGEVVTVKNGDEAIDSYKELMNKKNKFDVVILDMTIVGGESGIEIGKKILKIDRDAKIIISSGHTAHPIFKDYKKYGFVGAIKKPYTISELVECIEKSLVSC